MGSLPPSRSNVPSCSEPQNLGLGPWSHVADFVQQQRAAVRLLELADPPAVGPRKRPSLVAEQFALQERLREWPRS